MRPDKGQLRAVIRPFDLSDVWQVRRLHRDGTALTIEHVLTQPYRPLLTALTAPWPWAGKGAATFVFDADLGGQPATGFAQLVKRVVRPEADLLYLAPAIPAENAAATQTVGALWRLLLSYSCTAAAEHGLQRVFASTPYGGPEQACLKEVGFSLYTRETIYRLAAAPVNGDAAPAVRPQTPQDSWAVQRLYTRDTPRLVQQAEGATSGEIGSWCEPDSWEGVVWEPAGEVRAAAQIYLGQIGHWLRICGASELRPDELRTLIVQALRLTGGAHRALPVYVAVRDYEAGSSATLAGMGFEPLMERVRFVKHTVAAVRVLTPAPVPAREIWQEVPLHSRAEQPLRPGNIIPWLKLKSPRRGLKRSG